MTKHVLPRTLVPANLPRLAVGLTVVAGAALTGTAAFGADVPASAAGHPARVQAYALPQAKAHAQAPAQVKAHVKAQAQVKGHVKAYGQVKARSASPKAAVAPKQQRVLTAQALLRVAESQVGIKENSSGGGTPFHRWYMSSRRATETVARDGGSVRSYANAPWCAMFVSWVGEKAGGRPTVGWDAYTVAYAGWFKANRRWGAAAKPGAVVFFDWDGAKRISGIDHVGLVKKDNGDGTITTIEGNTGEGRVEQRRRPKAQVAGYGYPAYKG
ncbi:CHAP domain-containing protein [Nonomuraea lactucae]|uniref:CHAP domain-containing protein n=1 Tax=Nonomuraea lactucae TaxID=2249762 RepID=UPI000DE44980|nr:CHAP domain-containing protein [Nonomuraea lactucae]